MWKGALEESLRSSSHNNQPESCSCVSAGRVLLHCSIWRERPRFNYACVQPRLLTALAALLVNAQTELLLALKDSVCHDFSSRNTKWLKDAGNQRNKEQAEIQKQRTKQMNRQKKNKQTDRRWAISNITFLRHPLCIFSWNQKVVNCKYSYKVYQWKCCFAI